MLDYISPRCDLHIEDGDTFFLHDTLSRDNTPPHRVWLKKNVERLRRYRADTIRHTDRTSDGEMDEVIPIYPPPRIYTGV